MLDDVDLYIEATHSTLSYLCFYSEYVNHWRSFISITEMSLQNIQL